MFNAECEGSFLTACIKNVSGTRSVSFGAKVTRGHDYELRMKVECESETGVIGVDAICAFAPVEGDLFVDGFVTWNSFSVAVDDDLFGLINGLVALVENLQDDLDAHEANLGQHEANLGQHDDDLGQHDLDNKANQAAIAELLRTPEGQRLDFSARP